MPTTKRIIILEGLDYSGKTSQAGRLKLHFEGAGEEVWSARDPGSTKLSEELRRLVKDGNTPMTPRTQFLLFSAARSDLAEEIMRQHAAGKRVLMDRWWPSTYAYQGAQGIPDSDIIDMQARWSPLPAPLIIYLDVPVDVLAARKAAAIAAFDAANGTHSDAANDRFDSAKTDFKELLRTRYRALCVDPNIRQRLGTFPKPVVHLLAANGSPDTVFWSILSLIESHALNEQE